MSLKKLLLALPVLMTGFAMDAWAGKCERFIPGASKHRDEFLYVTRTYHNNKSAYGCGEYKVDGVDYGCIPGVKIYVTGEHYNDDDTPKGSASTLNAYACKTQGNDKWVQDDPSLIPWCGHYPNVTYLQAGFFEDNDKVYKCSNKVQSGSTFCVAKSTSDVCYRCKKELSCQLGGGKWVNETRNCNGSCSCSHKKDAEWNGGANKCVISRQACENRGGRYQNDGTCSCDSGEYFDKSAGHCKPKKDCTSNCDNVIITLENIGNTSTTVNGGNASVSDSGNSSNTNNNENNNNSKNTNGNNAGGKSGGAVSGCLDRPTALGITCCKAGKATRYFGPKTKSELDRGVNMPESCICLDAAGKDDATKEFDMASLSCVAKGSANQTKKPCACKTYMSVVANANACAKNAAADAVTKITKMCDDDAVDCNGIDGETYIEVITNAIANCNAQPVEPEKPQLNEQRLAAAVEAIDKYRSGLDVSVWKDAEGNFNTARLVSDSIAGVVLGTAGGLITSSVVKKNQVKNGFEDVVCTIGGQTVGSYGDEISVGIQ